MTIKPLMLVTTIAVASALSLTGCGDDTEAIAKDDFIEQVDSVITVGEFYQMASGGEIVFT